MSDESERGPAINLPPAVLWLAVLFVAVHVGRHFASEADDTWFVYALAFIPIRYEALGDTLPGGPLARFWSPVTYAFLHGDAVHLLVNIVWMASFGGPLARRFGSLRFLALSLVSTLAGAAVFYAMHADNQTLVIGASGAVSGMMAATARFAFSPDGPLSGGGARSFHVPAEPLGAALRNRRAVWFVLIWFAVNLIFGFIGGGALGSDAPIAWEAHLGGFLAGFLMFPLLDPIGRARPQ